MSKRLTAVCMLSIERDLRLIDSLISDLREGLYSDGALPIKKYARCIEVIAGSIGGTIDKFEGTDDARGC